MDTNSCVKYTLCVEWTTYIPFFDIPRTSPNIILLEGIEFNLGLTTLVEDFELHIKVKKWEEWQVLNKFTVTTFIRDDTCYWQPRLTARSKQLISELCNDNRKTLWRITKDEILAEMPDIFSYGELIIVCVFHSTDTDLDKNHQAHVSTQTTLSSVVSVDLQSLSREFSTLLKDETFSDVNLICADRTFSVNRSVLAARSEVFAAMFRNKMAEKEAGVVDIKDADPEVLELLLQYVYSAEIPDLCEETAHRLYEAADKYAVHGLRRACSDWMVECQTTDNCLDFFVLADKHSDENFKEAVVCFVAEHLPDLSVESWSTFRNNYPQLVLSVFEKRWEDSMPGSAKAAK